MNEEDTKLAQHFERVINNLNQHWHSIQLLLSHVSQPLKVDDRGLHAAFLSINQKVQELNLKLNQTIEQIQNLDLTHTFGEIKFIGKRLNQIEENIRSIKDEKTSKKIDLYFSVDGHKMIKEPDETLPKKDPEQCLKLLLKTLLLRESTVLKHRFGLSGEKSKTLEDTGKLIGISRERVRQIEAQAIRKCRHVSRKYMVDEIDHLKLKKAITGENE